MFRWNGRSEQGIQSPAIPDNTDVQYIAKQVKPSGVMRKRARLRTREQEATFFRLQNTIALGSFHSLVVPCAVREDVVCANMERGNNTVHNKQKEANVSIVAAYQLAQIVMLQNYAKKTLTTL